MMKLLFIHVKLGRGGVTSILINRMNFLAKQDNYEIHFLSETHNDELQVKKLDKRIKLHNIDLQKNINGGLVKNFINEWKYYFSTKSRLKSFFKENKFDIITAFPYGDIYKYLPWICKRSRLILEFHIPFLIPQKKGKKTLKSLFRPQFLFPDEKIIHNHYHYSISLTAEDLEDRSYLENNKLYIPNPVTIPSSIKDISSRENIIIAVGRLNPEKNFLDLIVAICKIKSELKSYGWKVKIYGEGPQYNLIKNKIKECELDQLVSLEGFKNNVNEIYNNSKILVSTSHYEGFGMSIIEALSFKTPVISYKCKCGPEEIISHKKNGFVIEPNPEILALHLLKFIRSENLINEMSINAHYGLQRFDAAKIYAEWVKFYEHICYK